MKNKNEYTIIALAALVAGCMSLPSVGPDYNEVTFELPETSMPDAGMPIEEFTTVGEYKSAEGDKDVRTEITTNEIVSWWSKFNDPLLEKLVERAVSDNRSYLVAQERLTQARWQLFGAYAAFMSSKSRFPPNAFRAVSANSSAFLRASGLPFSSPSAKP